MGSFCRSEELDLYSLLIPRESAYSLFSRLGDQEVVHFIDAEPSAAASTRLHYKQTKRCEELLRTIDEIHTILETFGFDSGIGKGNVTDFLRVLEIQRNLRKSSDVHYIDDLEAVLFPLKQELKKNASAIEELTTQINHMIEERFCLQSVRSYLIQDQSGPLSAGRLIGSIKSEDALRFQKIVFRALKGNCITIVQPIDSTDPSMKLIDPANPNNNITRSFFFVLFNQTSTSSFTRNKLIRVCNSFNAHMFNTIHDEESSNEKGKFDPDESIRLALEYQQKNAELLRLTYNHLQQLFESILVRTDEITLLEQYRLTIHREHVIYSNLNLTKNTGAVLKAQVWLPKSIENKIISYLQEVQDPKYASAQLHQAPRSDFTELQSKNLIPSRIRSNEFLCVFQEIVSTYGVPRYREINPALFTIVTFPFLFGVMFGDVGHGALLLAFGVYLMFSYNQAKHATDVLYKCRYIISMMGFFATFCGFIYGDFMSLPVWFFGSCYSKKQGSSTMVRESDSCVVRFGLDPVWLDAQNSLQFYNSFKMKLAIILGIAHMSLGLLLKGLNNIISVNAIDFFFEFIPQLCFLLSTFGYMVLLIIVKWLTPFDSELKSPSILTTMLNIALKSGEVPAGKNALLGSVEEQESIQLILLVVALVSVPMMLIPKPLILYLLNNNKKKSEGHSGIEIELSDSASHGGHDHFDLSEIIVHQVIESIEFVLGSISHTASYLRLWALSLAHSQLAKVFFEKTLLPEIESHSVVGIVIQFAVFAMISFAVLMCMDVMECFLHTLRLHWVEFQSKFYKADGNDFMPFSFKTALVQQQSIREQQ